LNRNFLHAARLGFSHPSTGAWIEVRAPLPEDLRVYFEQIQATSARSESEIKKALAPYL
jgi:23S rRNA pseudouridine1911/1915/1917 synthase